MIKNLLSWPLIIFFLLLTLLLSSYYGDYQLTRSIKNNTAHLETIIIANDISSFVKRAEGHLFLYLTLGDISDRDKFFNRIDSLKINLSLLKDNDQFDADTYLDAANEMLRIGWGLIDYKDKSILNDSDFQFESHKDEMLLLHRCSSEIRVAGVDLVNNTTTRLDKSTDNTLDNSKSIYIIFFISGIACLLLIVLQIKQRTTDLENSVKLAQDLDKISNTDELTKIGNRRSFNSVFVTEWQRAIRNKKSMALMIIDIDYFKLFNDTYGHVEGDMCLMTVAQALKSCMKRPADSIWRYGGEEFAIVLPDTDNAYALAESCRKAIESLQIPHKTSKVSNVLTISIGICICTPDQDTNSISFIIDVDKALYRAKESGRNKVCTDNDKDDSNVVDISTTKNDAN
jgi:diguanylate cyclase (GGDEF)-like protein